MFITSDLVWLAAHAKILSDKLVSIYLGEQKSHFRSLMDLFTIVITEPGLTVDDGNFRSAMIYLEAFRTFAPGLPSSFSFRRLKYKSSLSDCIPLIQSMTTDAKLREVNFAMSGENININFKYDL